LEIFQFHLQNSQYFFHNLWTGDGLGHRILLFLEPGTGNHSFKNATAYPQTSDCSCLPSASGEKCSNYSGGYRQCYYAIDVVWDAK